ncbi:MAG: ATP-binding protein, partial [Thermodesulfobacteriota bacterium]|nr:ATP-binding protein [Thermodesulfobacteriota bacterium]
PESEMMSDVRKSWQKIALIAVSVLVLGFVLALRLVNKYSYQLRDLPKQNISDSHNREELLALIEAGESATLEFKSTMRMNLKSGKKGKEIELAWLKTVAAFMNSDGGILLIGVEDNGTIMGIERDGFENEDRCGLHFKSLFNHHIGPEFSRFVTLKIISLDEKTILIIECERVRKPVFLTVGKNEDFFVRSGPSSMKMSMSQMMQYLEERR